MTGKEAQPWSTSEWTCIGSARTSSPSTPRETHSSADGSTTIRASSCRIFGELGPETLEVAFEATYGWGWFADLLADAGISTHMSHPLATKAISAARVKNDAVDARTLAHLLRTNLLPEAWIAPPEAREVRRLVRMRTSLVRIRSQLKCQVHALVAEHAVQVPMWDLFGKAGRLLLADLQLPAVSQGRVQASLRMIDAISDEIAAADREIRELFHLDPRVARLSAIRGSGRSPQRWWLPKCGT